jgi:hypothetical protein
MTDNTTPFSDVDTIDIVGTRVQGGLDLVISVKCPIDASSKSLTLLKNKITNYINGARSPAFLAHYGQKVGAPVAIYISCAYPISAEALEVIEKMRAVAASHEISLEVRQYMGKMH